MPPKKHGAALDEDPWSYKRCKSATLLTRELREQQKARDRNAEKTIAAARVTYAQSRHLMPVKQHGLAHEKIVNHSCGDSTCALRQNGHSGPIQSIRTS